MREVPTAVRRRLVVSQLAALLPWVVLAAWPVLGTVHGEPSTTALAALAWVGLWFVADAGLGLGLFTALPRWWGSATAAGVVAVLLVARPSISLGAVDVAGLWPWLLVLALVVCPVRDARHGVADPAVSLARPVSDGPWRVVEGSTRLLNHPRPAPQQRAAPDLVALGPWGHSYRPVPMRFDAVRGGHRRGSVLRRRLQGEV